MAERRQPVSEQAKLLEGVERFLIAVCPEHGQRVSGHRKCAAGRVGVSLGCNRDTEVVETIRRSDLPAILAQRDAEWREGLLGDEARNALYDAHMHYQARAPHEQSEDGWLEALLTAALDKAAPDGGGGE